MTAITQRVHVHEAGEALGMGRAFLLAALEVISSWSVGGLFLLLGPQLASSLSHTTDHLMAASASLSSPDSPRWRSSPSGARHRG